MTATATRNDVHSKAINFEDVHSGLPRCHEGRFTFSRALNFGEHVLGYLLPFGFLRLCLFLCVGEMRISVRTGARLFRS